MNQTPEQVVLAHAHTTGLPLPNASENPKHGPSIGRSTLVNLLGLLVPTVVGLATVPLYLHQIGEIRYGVLLLAFTFLGYFGAFDLGLGRAVAQRVARQDSVEDRNHTFWTAFLLSCKNGLTAAFSLCDVLCKTGVNKQPRHGNQILWPECLSPIRPVTTNGAFATLSDVQKLVVSAQRTELKINEHGNVDSPYLSILFRQ